MVQYPTIEIFMKNADGKSPDVFGYVATTTQSKTCKEAKKKFCNAFWRFKPSARNESLVKCSFKK